MKASQSVLVVICLVTYLAACQNKSSNENPLRKSPTHDVATLKVDTTIEKLPETTQPAKKTGYKSVYPKGTWKTYPQICRSLFGVGSTKEEVIQIMGRPELIEYPKAGYEKWFYGKVEITFRYTYVDEVYREDLCPKYVSYMSLLTSDDPIERRFGAKLLEGSVKQYQY